jgi:predicted ATPase/DNA-binding SARP family transcriptional activator
VAEIRVLGPLEVVGEEGAVALSAPMHRRLLAALLVETGRSRSADVLVEALWGSALPASAAKLLQVYVSNLRGKLPPPIRIETRGAGYALELGDGVLDAARFERLLSDARTASRDGNATLAASLLRRALGLWRGQAYGELAYEDFARSEAERLEDLRLVAVEDRIDAELQLGHDLVVLPELRSLAATHPLRERLQAQAMLALYRCGHQADALEVYTAARRKLVDELGIEPGAELRDLQQRVLRHDPALAASPTPHEAIALLPASPNPLLGRERELGQLRELLRRDGARLIVLTGAGGSGKTRLALEAARANARSFANGAAFVSLAPVRDPELLVIAICDALGIQATGVPLDALTSALAPRELLLLLDNAEHLRSGTPILAELVGRAPRVTILVTSRVVLHLSGEHVYPVDPLSADAAVQLFLERAQEADARFQPDPAETVAVRRVCERLDGLPLAIELAAGWIRTLAPTELLSRLDPRLPLLSGGPRDLPARQRTLRATLEWSLDLLDAAERRDLARLSVFTGGCTLEAAEAICDTTLDRLSSLVDHHLVIRSVGPSGSRYSLLETIREFAAEQLEALGEAGELRRRHAAEYATIANSLGLSADELGSGVRQRHDVALAEQDNMRAALDWAVDEEPALGLELAIALEQFWVSTSPREGAQRFQALLDRAGDIPAELRARALRDLGGSMEISGEPERAAGAYARSLALFERLNHEAGILRLFFRLSNVAFTRGDIAGARTLLEQTLARARAGGFRYEESELLGTLSLVEYRCGEIEKALELQLSSLQIIRELGGWAWGEPNRLVNAAEFSVLLNRLHEAETYGRQALKLSCVIGDRIAMTYELAVLALAARAGGDDKRAGRLWGAIEAEEARAFLGQWPADREDYATRILLPDSAQLEQGREDGGRLTLDEAVAYALEAPPTNHDSRPDGPQKKRTSRPGPQERHTRT